ncbi:MAG: hypothetical protein E3K36_06385 [Candidatus Brocadia sp.]|nr:hypothetical protein [Candidatus Brocadia sp.]
MSNAVIEVRRKYDDAKQNVEACQASILELQKKCDELQESLPELSRAIENAKRAKTSALDAFALNSNEKNCDRLKRVRLAHEDAIKQRGETQELLEASERGLKTRQAEFIRLNEAMSVARRQCWETVADEIQKKISTDMIMAIQELIICKTQTGGTRQHVLNTIFPQLNPGEYQSSRDTLMEQYNID